MALDDAGCVVLEPSLGRATCGSSAAVVGALTLHLMHNDSFSADVVAGAWLLTSWLAVAFPSHAVQ